MRIFILLFFFTLSSCLTSNEEQKSEVESQTVIDSLLQEIRLKDSLIVQKKHNAEADSKLFYSRDEIVSFEDETFVLLRKLDTTFSYNMKYATQDNFLKERVYDCDECMMRYETAKRVIAANKVFKRSGFRIQFFDCYRPLDVQKKMWEIFPDKRYVANPLKGSNHNRGTALDITLVDMEDKPLDMGTEFDYFGVKAHHSFKDFPEAVNANRALLRSVMLDNGFWTATSEWWHYNLNRSKRYAVSNFKVVCLND